MRLSRIAFVCMLCWASLPRPAAADPINVVVLARSASAGAFIPGGPLDDHAQNGADALTATAFVASGLNTAAGAGTLISSLSADHRVFTGVGSATAESQSTTATTNAHGAANFAYQFQLTSPQVFQFVGNFTSSGTQASSTNALEEFGNWTASLRPAASVTGGPFAFDAFDTRSINESGVLAAGMYVFSIAALSVANTSGGPALGSAQFSFHFALSDAPASPSPEPASMTLLGTGVLTLAGLWRRRRRAVSSS